MLLQTSWRRCWMSLVIFTSGTPSTNTSISMDLRLPLCGRGACALLHSGRMRFLADRRVRPIGLERRYHFLDDRRAGHEQADLTPLVKLERAQALAADERLRAVPHHGADVQPVPVELLVHELV